MHALVFANGNLGDTACPHDVDLVLCADGGVRHANALGIRPDAVIGDLDSLPDREKEALEGRGVYLIRYPRAKDETDLELALLYAAERGAQRITVLGVRGGRLDHELGNLLLLAHPALCSIDVRLRDGVQEAMLVAGERTLNGQEGDLLSLLSIGGDVHGVTTQGLEYALHDETLRLGPARGVSNVFINSTVVVRVRSGLLLAVHTRQRDGQTSTAA
jgi:thiamine pyrophosphokinase